MRRLAQAGLMIATGVALTALYAGGAGRLAAAARPIYAKDAPVIRVSGAEVPAPYARNLELAAFPSEEDIIEAVRRSLYRGA